VVQRIPKHRKSCAKEQKEMRFYRRKDPDDDVFPRQKVEPKMKLKFDPDRDGSRPNLCGKTGWKGTLGLPNLTPVSFGCDLDPSSKNTGRNLVLARSWCFMGKQGSMPGISIFVRTLEVKLGMKISATTITAMIGSFGSISVQNATLLPRMLMMQDRAEFLPNFETKSGKFLRRMDLLSFAKAMEMVARRRYSFALQNTKDWKSALFVSQSAGINTDTTFI